LIAAANAGQPGARQAVIEFARRLAQGCTIVVDVLDPEMIVLSGGLAQDNPLLFTELERHLAESVPVWNRRRVAIVPSKLGYYAGTIGAAAVALERLS
jgi:glucokinase